MFEWPICIKFGALGPRTKNQDYIKHVLLVGGFTDFSQIGSFPQVGGKNKKYLKPPPSLAFSDLRHWTISEMQLQIANLSRIEG